MDLAGLVDKLTLHNVNRLVKAIDKDWYMNNLNNLMGINNRQFLLNYIEDNINKNIPISPPLMQDECIQDILQVHRFDYKNLNKPDFSGVKNLVVNHQKIYYSLIGRIDSYKMDILMFVVNIDFYTAAISHMFPNYQVEFTPYRVYSLVRLLDGINVHIRNIRDLTLPVVYNYRKYTDIFIEYISSFTTRNLADLFVVQRFLAIICMLTDHLENFKSLHEKSKMYNTLPDVTFWYENLSYRGSGPELQLIKMYGRNLMALVCALGKIEFMKYLLSRGDQDFKMISYVGENRLDTQIALKYGSTVGSRASKGDPVPSTFAALRSQEEFKYFTDPLGAIQEDLLVETYLTISLKYNHFEVATYLLNNGYPMQIDYLATYDVLKDITLNCADKNVAARYVEYVKLNRDLSYAILDIFKNKDLIKELIKSGANPNVILYRRRIPILFSFMDDPVPIAETLIESGASLEHLDQLGRNAVFYITSMKAFELCKKYKVNFNHIDYNGLSGVYSLLSVDEDLKVIKLLMAEMTDESLNKRDRIIRSSYLFQLAAYRGDEDIRPYLDRFNLDIFDFQGLDVIGALHGAIRPKTMIYLTQRGVRGIQAYKSPMFYLPKKNADCPNDETVGLIEVNDPEDDFIIMFKDFGYSDITHRHKQEPMCIAVSELNELYFKLVPGTEEFEWNLPTTRRTHRLGSDQVENSLTVLNLTETLTSVLHYMNPEDPRKDKLQNDLALILENYRKYFVQRNDYYRVNIAVFETLNPNQLKLLETLMMMVFKLGEFMRRWGGDEETTMKLYGKADNFPYPMQLSGPNLVMMSDGTMLNLIDGYNKHILIRSRDYPVDKPEGIVPYAEDMAAEQLSVIDHFINNYFTIKHSQDVVDYQTTNIWDLLRFIRKNTSLDLRILLKEIDSELPTDILVDVENNQRVDINLTVEQVKEHMRKRVEEIAPLEKFYKNIFEYTMHISRDGSKDIVSTNRRIYHTLDAIRPRRDGSIDEAALGDCIQLKNQDFILTAYQYFKTFLPDYSIPRFNIEEFRPMHY